MIGKTIGQYQVIDKIGEGGMGAVYKAEDTTLHRLVALKTLSTHLTEDEEAQKRFIREAQSASSLNHPNITTVYEFIEDDDARLICMEYVEGKTIRDMVESGVVSVRKAIDIIMQAAEALDAAHNKGILHRDVKSANIMVNMEGRVKVMDFGLAHLEEKSQLTRTGTTMGTLSYSSPEQISGKPVDRRSEIFSLGIVFYELLTGQLPFKASNEAEILFAIINNEPPKLSKLRDDVPELVEAIVSRMLEKNSDLRYPTCGDVINDLKGIRKEMETSTVGISGALERVRTSRRKLMIQRLAIGVVGVAIIAIGLILLSRDRKDLDPNRLVVAVFDNRTQDESLDYLGEWAADYVISGIDQTGLIGVVPFDYSSIASPILKGKAERGEITDPIQMLAEETSAGIAISGNFYLLDDNNLQFQIRIRDTAKEETIEALEITGFLINKESVLEQIRQNILGVLATHLNQDFSAWASISSRPPTIEAFQSFTNGLESYFGGGARDQTIMHFNRAASLDSTYITPLIWAARVHIVKHTTDGYAAGDSLLKIINQSRDKLSQLEQYFIDWLATFTVADNEERYQIARIAAKQVPGTMWSFDAAQSAMITNRLERAVDFAYEVDPESSLLLNWGTYMNQLTQNLNRLGRHEEALDQVRNALKERPGEPYYLIYEESCTLAILGKVEEISSRLITFEEDPAFHTSTDVGPRYLTDLLMYLRAYGHLEEADKLIDRTFAWYEARPDLQKRAESFRNGLARTYYLTERWKEAETIYKQLSEEFPEDIWYLGTLGCLAARLGNQEEALRISSLLEPIKYPYVFPGYSRTPIAQRARIAALLGDKEQAVSLLEEAFEQGMHYNSFDPLDIDFESIRDYLPYMALIRPRG